MLPVVVSLMVGPALMVVAGWARPLILMLARLVVHVWVRLVGLPARMPRFLLAGSLALLLVLVRGLALRRSAV